MVYAGINVPVKEMNRECFGQGKWKNFVMPPISPDVIGNGLFADFGCNAGMYLIEALYAGFETVYGIEAAKPAYAQLQLTKDFHDKCDIRTIFAAIGKLEKNIADSDAEQFSFDRFPIVDLSLMANITYWIENDTLAEFAKQLAYKSKYVIIVVARDAKNYDNWNKCFDIDHWNLRRVIDNTGHSGERPTYSVLLSSRKLIRLDVDDLFEKHVVGDTLANKKFYTEFWPGYVLQPHEWKHRERVRYWLETGEMKTKVHLDDEAKEKLDRWDELLIDMKKGIMLEPIELTGKPSGDYFDGFHRLGTAKQLGWKYIYAKKKESV